MVLSLSKDGKIKGIFGYFSPNSLQLNKSSLKLFGNSMLRQFYRKSLPAIDVLLVPFVFIASLLLKQARTIGLQRLPMVKATLRKTGVLPILHHYYDPVVYEDDLRQPLSSDRHLPGLDLNVPGQLALLKRFDFAAELAEFPMNSKGDDSFYYRNTFFESGDAEFLYSIVRLQKPAGIIEIGAGHSTRIIRAAMAKNQQSDPDYTCSHKCIEPFENPFLEASGAEIIRLPVEDVPLTTFKSLSEGDILLIDSTHMIRPQGDVLFEYFDILGSLQPGVLVHVHDIFTPKDYPDNWVLDKQLLWNEQYLLEALLSYSDKFEVIGALNYLWHNHRELVSEKFPVLAQQPTQEPGSFWFRIVR